MFSLKGKVALVTGGGSGIGRAISVCFAASGAVVYVIDRNAEAAQQTVDAIRTAGHAAELCLLDITDAAACDAAVLKLLSTHGQRIDVLVNNAGIGKVGTILETSPIEMQQLFAVNVMGAFHLCHAVLPSMTSRQAGSIINIASIAGLEAVPDRFAYTTSKFAVVGMTKAMAVDHGHTKVRINCICPGRIDTPFVQQRLREYPDPEKFRQQMIAGHFVGRLGRPEEIAAAALFLAADESAFVNGASLTVDGGFTAGK